jgi:tRNA A37 threonylcarbamoyltransferase TsaD
VILKLDFYMKKYKINNLFIGGGVSANNLLRKVLKEQKQ